MAAASASFFVLHPFGYTSGAIMMRRVSNACPFTLSVIPSSPIVASARATASPFCVYTPTRSPLPSPCETRSMPGMASCAPWHSALTAESRTTTAFIPDSASSTGRTIRISLDGSPPSRHTAHASASSCIVTSPSSSPKCPTRVRRSSIIVAPGPRTSPMS